MTNTQGSKIAQQVVELLKEKSVTLRLEEVVNLIDDSADRTIDLIENSLPITEMIAKDCAQISKQLAKNKIKDFEAHIAHFLDNLNNNILHVHNALEEIILSQKNQYATAMVANKFIDDLKDLESKLSEFIEKSCGKEVHYETNPN